MIVLTNRLNKIFQNLKKKNEKALITFSVSGYPNEETSLEICKAVSDGGAHIHEINIPAELIKKMRHSKCIVIENTVENRAKFLVSRYTNVIENEIVVEKFFKFCRCHFK